MSKVIRASVALVALLIAIPSALAKPPSAEETKARAKEMVVRGTEAFDAHRYDEAARLFLEAHALLATNGLELKPELLHNAAVAYEMIGDCEKIADLLSRYLELLPPGRADAAVEERYARAAECAPKVSITSSPNAEIAIDGQRRGTTPIVTHLRTGEHEVVLRAKGYLRLQATLEVRSARAVSYDLEPNIGSAEQRLVQGNLQRDSADRKGEISPWIWPAAGAGLAALAAGVFFGLRSSSEHSIYEAELEKPDECECRDPALIRSSEESSKNLALGANISYGVAIAGAVVVAVILVSGGSSRDDVAAVVSGDGLAIGIEF
jgi:hypothetical protein